ncbi:hypothetical protein J6590_024310, partial [Homalodisca vitripennis]
STYHWEQQKPVPHLNMGNLMDVQEYQIKWQGSLILTERTKSKVIFEHNQWSDIDGSVDNSFIEEPLRAARLCYLAITSVLYPRPPLRGRRAAQVRLLAVTTDNSSTVCCSPGSVVSRVKSRGSVLSLLYSSILSAKYYFSGSVWNNFFFAYHFRLLVLFEDLK